jgi:curved DNA-binding protein CbpA
MFGERPRRDYYAVLGVEHSASARQVTSAYRRLVRSLHPDARPEDPAAAEGLAEVLAAYDTLRDPARRAAYDAGRSGPAASANAGQPVPVRVTRRARTSPVRSASPSRARRETSSLLDAPEGLLFPLFTASSRIGPRFAVSGLEWEDRDFLGRVVRQWLRQTGPWSL